MRVEKWENRSLNSAPWMCILLIMVSLLIPGFLLGGSQSLGNAKNLYKNDADDIVELIESSDGSDNFKTQWGGIKNDYAGGFANDSEGNFYACGKTKSFDSEGYDAYIAKFSDNGQLIWNRSWGGLNNDVGADLVVLDDAVYMCGETNSLGAGFYDAFIAKFNTDGDEIWNKTWGSSLREGLYELEKSSDGYIYGCGYTDSYDAEARDGLIIKYDQDGNRIWNQSWGYSDDDYFSHLECIKDGNVTVCGQTLNSTLFRTHDEHGIIPYNDLVELENSGVTADMVFVKFDCATGSETLNLTIEHHGYDKCNDMLYDGGDFFYVAARIAVYNCQILKFNLSLGMKWAATLSDTRYHMVLGFNLEDKIIVYMGGSPLDVISFGIPYNFYAVLNPSGIIEETIYLWDLEFPRLRPSKVIHADSEFYVAGSVEDDDTAFDLYIMKLDFDPLKPLITDVTYLGGGQFKVDCLITSTCDSGSFYGSDRHIDSYNNSLSTIFTDTFVVHSGTEPLEVSATMTFEDEGYQYVIIRTDNFYNYSISDCIRIYVDFVPDAVLLDSTADEIENDGVFTIQWDESNYADNYSIYIHDKQISNTNDTKGISPYATIQGTDAEISIEADGNYYLCVVANSRVGGNVSSYIKVNVELKADNTAAIAIGLSSVFVGLASAFLVVFMRYRKKMRRLNVLRQD
mgnify:CR=1 FL=1